MADIVPITTLSLSEDAKFCTSRAEYIVSRTDTLEEFRSIYQRILKPTNTDKIRLNYINVMITGRGNAWRDGCVDSGAASSLDTTPTIWPCGSEDDVLKLFEQIMNWKGKETGHYVRVYAKSADAAVSGLTSRRTDEMKCTCDQNLKDEWQLFCPFCKIEQRRMYGYLTYLD